MSDTFIVPVPSIDTKIKFSVDPNDMNNWVLSNNYQNQLGKYKYIRYEDLSDNLKKQLEKKGSVSLVNDNRRSVDYDTVSAEQQSDENGNKTVYRIAVNPDGQSLASGNEYDAWQQYVMNPNNLYINGNGEVEIMPEGEKPYGSQSVLQPYHDSFRPAFRWVYKIPGHEGEPVSEQDAKAWGLTTGNVVYGKDDWNDPSENFMNDALFTLATLPEGGVKLATNLAKGVAKASTGAAKSLASKFATKELAKQTGMNVGKLLAKYVAAPYLASKTFDLLNTGVNYLVGEGGAPLLTEQIADRLKELGVNDTVAEIAGDSANPGQWINFGGTGKYTGQLLQKAGLGLEKTMSEKLAEKAGAQFLARMKKAEDPSEFQKYYKLALDATRDKFNSMGERIGKLVNDPLYTIANNDKVINTVTKLPPTKRALEIVMRSSLGNSGVENFIKSLNTKRAEGFKAFKPQINYILFGKNDRWRRIFRQPKYNPSDRTIDPSGRTYTGLWADTTPIEGNDIIDSYLYGVPLDDQFNAWKMENPDYGIFTDYVKENYPGRKIQVYEFGDDPGDVTNIGNHQLIDDDPATPYFQDGEWNGPFMTDFMDAANQPKQIDVSGHHSLSGTSDLMGNVTQNWDIWKFNPNEYAEKWLSPSDRWKYTGLKWLDKAGNPIIFKQNWWKSKNQ